MRTKHAAFFLGVAVLGIAGAADASLSTVPTSATSISILPIPMCTVVPALTAAQSSVLSQCTQTSWNESVCGTTATTQSLAPAVKACTSGAVLCSGGAAICSQLSAYHAAYVSHHSTDSIYDKSVQDFDPTSVERQPLAPMPLTFTDVTSKLPVSPSYYGYNAPKGSWAGQEDLAKTQALSIPPTLQLEMALYGTPYERNYGWDSNGPNHDGQGVDSCEEYVYESFFEVERWTDAVNACGSDVRCAFNKTFANYNGYQSTAAPGIIRRDLKARDGQSLVSYYGVEGEPYWDWNLFGGPGGWMGKNDFYAGTDWLFPPSMGDALAGNPAAAAVFQAVYQQINKGQQYYQVQKGTPSGGAMLSNGQEAFFDWTDFHWSMNKRTAALDVGQIREFRSRNQGVQTALSSAVAASQCWEPATLYGTGGTNPLCQPGPETPPYMLPPQANPEGGDPMLWRADPFAERQVYSGVSASLFAPTFDITASIPTAIETVGQLGYTGLVGGIASIAPAVTTSLGNVGLTQTSVVPYSLTQTLPGANPFAAFSPVATMSIVGAMWKNRPFVLDGSSDHVRLDCTFEAGGSPGRIGIAVVDPARVAVCNATNVVLDEYAFAQSGKPSCMVMNPSDPRNYMCDWSPDDFVQSISATWVNAWNLQKEQEYKLCKGFTGGGQVNPHVAGYDPKATIPDANRVNLTAFRSVLKQRKAALAKILKNVPMKSTDVFGTRKQAGSNWGTSSFGADYNYDLGWEVRIKRAPSGNICQFGGSVAASFQANAHMLGMQASIVDVGFGLTANDSSGQADPFDGKAHLTGHADIFSYELFQPVDTTVNLNQTITNTPSDHHDPMTIFETSIPVWIFTVDVQVGIDFEYGLKTSITTAAPTTCIDLGAGAQTNLFQATATFTPFANLNVDADIGVSLAGIIGVGVEVDLLAIGLDLPLTASAQVVSQNNSLGLQFGTSLDLQIHTLDGSLSPYVEIFWQKIKHELVSWQGLSFPIRIFNTKTQPIALADLAEPIDPTQYAGYSN